MQEDIENKSVVLSTRTAKITAQGLAILMRAALRKMRQVRDAPIEGKQTVKQLARGGSLQSIEIKEDNIKAFEPYARKYGVSYALQRDNDPAPDGSVPRWLVFFRAKDTDALTAAFQEFSDKIVKREKKKPSIRQEIRKEREADRNAIRGRTRHKQREGPEL